VASFFADVASKVTGKGSNIAIETGNVRIADGARISVSTFGAGNAGELNLTAKDIELVGINPFKPDVFSGIFAVAYSEATGGGGNLTINTDRLRIADSSRITVSTLGAGNAGELNLTAKNIELVGVNPIETEQVSAISARVNSKATGSGGNLTINTERLRIADGARITVSTEGAGNAGELNLTAKDIELVGANPFNTNPSGIFAEVQSKATGSGGNLIINTERLKIADGSRISVNRFGIADGTQNIISTLGAGNEGNLEDVGRLKINADSIQLDNQGAITAETRTGQGGDIELQANDFLILRNGSKISTTANTDGDGGNIKIDSPLIVGFPSSNSDIIANASEGKGGNINITTEAIFGLQERSSNPPNLTNDIDASSEFGLDGNISIDIPDIDPSEKLVELPVELLTTPEPLQTCQPRREQNISSFTNIGRGGLPPGPEEVSSNTVWEDWRFPHLGDKPLDSKQVDSFTDSKLKTITEAQGWIVNPNGKVMLTARSPVVTPSNLGQKASMCHFH
jgi:large exoprotein involved in heme utilization and adhesion